MDPFTPPSRGGRGQAFTLEAVVASVVVLGSVLFALQVAGVTSLAGSTSSGQLLEQEEATAAGVLDAAAAEDAIKPAVLAWDGDDYYTAGPPGDFGDRLEDTLGNRSLAYNVNLYYTDGEELERARFVRSGVPSDDAARTTRTITLYDDEIEGRYFMPNADSGGPVYNVVRVEVVVWPV